ncbi:MAG TPA: DUF6152 family protein [Vicinamibacterales bacterium]|jgi:hypothetical protein|nr:DUF6152 family protein [Vicinamibacterales bacterium]
MRPNRLLPAAFMLFVSGPAFAQDWIEYTSTADFFTVNFPSEPKVEETTYRSEYGYDLPARVYRAEAGQSRYSATIVCTVKEVQLINPHSWIYLEVKDGKGETAIWALEATAPAGLARAGVKKGDLRPGDTIKVRCNQLRDGSNGCLLGFVTPTHGDKARGDGVERDWDGPRAGADPRDALAK